MNKYNKEISLIEQKKLLLNILDTIDAFCEEYNIRYFLTGGTLLGAIRHKGFIPWDDDIDIAMLRPDYERFIALFNKYNERYKVIHYSNTPGYYYAFAKVIDNKTALIEENIDNSLEIGAYVDVFPIDFGTDSIDETYAIRSKKMMPWLIMDSIKTMDRNKTRKYYKTVLMHILKLALKPIPLQYIVQRIDEVAKINIKKTDAEYCGALVILMYGKKEIMRTEWYSKSIKVDFENHLFYAPLEYKKVLTNLYGDYMELPPVEKRISHHHYKLYWKTESLE